MDLLDSVGGRSVPERTWRWWAMLERFAKTKLAWRPETRLRAPLSTTFGPRSEVVLRPRVCLSGDCRALFFLCSGCDCGRVEGREFELMGVVAIGRRALLQIWRSYRVLLTAPNIEIVGPASGE